MACPCVKVWIFKVKANNLNYSDAREYFNKETDETQKETYDKGKGKGLKVSEVKQTKGRSIYEDKDRVH